MEIGRRAGHVQFLTIAAVFLGPLAVAAWLYFQGDEFVPAGHSNHGALLEPIVNLGDTGPGSRLLASHDGNWLLLYANARRCDADCRDALYTLRQSRLMLGKDMPRLDRLFLHAESAPDTVFLTREHVGLNTLDDAALLSLLDDRRPAGLPGGGYYLIDPLGNLVMYFRPDIDPADMVGDIKHLLKLSRIG